MKIRIFIKAEVELPEDVMLELLPLVRKKRGLDAGEPVTIADLLAEAKRKRRIKFPKAIRGYEIDGRYYDVREQEVKEYAKLKSEGFDL